MKKKKILMVGPDRVDKGGVATVVNQYFESNLIDEFDLGYVGTSACGNIFIKLTVYLIALVKILLFVPRYEIIHIHMSSRASFYRKRIVVLICNYLYNKPVIIHLHGSEFKEFYAKESSKKQQQSISRLFTSVKRVVVLSEQWKDFVLQVAPKSKISIVYNSVPVFPEKKDYSNANILFLGRIGERKGIYDLIDVVPELLDQDLKVYVGGDGDVELAKEKCHSLRVDNRVDFLGWIDKDEKEKLFERCSMFVLPSYNEGLPMAMLEAMSHGLAVIVSDVGGIPAVIHNNENGIIIHAGDKEKLRSEINKLLHDPSEKMRIGVAGRQSIINNYSIEKHVINIKMIYNDILS